MIGLSYANDRQGGVFQSIENGAKPGAETQFYPSFQGMVTCYVGLGETVFLFLNFTFILYVHIFCLHMCMCTS